LETLHRQFALVDEAPVGPPDVTIVMPCLNEAQSLPHCIGNALEALSRLREEMGLSGEIVIADNGSTDGSQALGTALGARVVAVTRRGYGAALIGGCEAAFGRYIVMGDCDGSYDFTEGVAMVGKLEQGFDLCMGSRFKGGIAPGAMPWKNRYNGNPALTGILNLFFRSGITDAHCGLRAIRKEAFERLRLTGNGMEFASEMVIKGALLRLKMAEVPATLSPDLRERAPHLRPWRDGWRHLRYLFMLSPTWVFGVPGLAALLLASVILGGAAAQTLFPGSAPAIGDYWTVLGGGLLTIGQLALLMTCAGHLFALRNGYRLGGARSRFAARYANLETLLAGGGAAFLAGAAILVAVAWEWIARDFRPATSIFFPVIGTALVIIGLQTVMAGFLMAIISGNEAEFLPAKPHEPKQAPRQEPAGIAA
jgi:hypothetical protein